MREFGIGITTFNRPDVLEFTLSQFDRFGGDIVIVDDHSDGGCSPRCTRNPERLGIAKSKNKCISLLKGCKRIFLFDDDCFPIVPDWWMPFIDGGMHHYVYACQPHITIKEIKGLNTYWNGALGCCMMIDQDVLQEVGGMDNRFQMWGYEHAEYSHRIHRAGLIDHSFITPNNVSDLIWSFDAYGSYPDFVWHRQSSISNEDKLRFAQTNAIVYQQIGASIKYCPYD